MCLPTLQASLRREQLVIRSAHQHFAGNHIDLAGLTAPRYNAIGHKFFFKTVGNCWQLPGAAQID